MLLFPAFVVIFSSMKMMRYIIPQAVAIVLIGAAAAFTFNGISINGIDPFRKLNDVALLSGETVGADEEGITIVGIEKVQELSDAGGFVIDARTAEEYEEGHIPGAILLDYYEMGRYMDEVLPILSPEDEIIVYCTGPDCEDSEMLARELFILGFKQVAVYTGGMEGWIEAGRPVETGPRSSL